MKMLSLQKTGKQLSTFVNLVTVEILLLLLSIIIAPTSSYAGSAKICEHYLGADATVTQSTDSSNLNSIYYGEACAFKFNIHSMVYDSPAHAAVGGEVSQTGRLQFGIYLQTQDWGLHKVFELPPDAPTPDLTDPAVQAENYERHLKWFYDLHGFIPAALSYQGGGANPLTTGMLFHYMLTGRTSDFIILMTTSLVHGAMIIVQTRPNFIS